MAEAAAVKEPEKSLWERVGRVGNLLNQGVESMVYGTLSLPALVADGYLNIYRTGREALGGEAFQESNLYARSKQSLTDWGRKMDGSYGKVVGPQNDSERKIVFGAELVTGLVGPGAIKSLKTVAEGKTAFNAAATAAKPAAATAETAATAKTAQAAEGTIEWVAPTLSKETQAAAAKMTADRAAREAAAANATKATAAEAGAGLKVTKEAVEGTSKSLLGTAATAGKYTWTGAKILAAPIAYPKTFWLGASAGHVLTGGVSSSLIWGGYAGLWNLGKEYVPGASAAVLEGSLKLGDGLTGFLATGAKKGAAGLAEHLPPVLTPAPVKAALGAIGATSTTGGDGPSLKDRAGDAFAGAKDKAEDAVEDVTENAGDFLEGEQAKPFRDMLGKFMGMDGKDVNGKAITAALGQKAKDNPHIALGMAIGAMSGMKNSNSKMEMAWKVPLYSAMWGIAFMMLGPILQPLMGLLGQKMDGLKDQFHKSQVAPYANGALPSTAEPKTAAPAADKPAMPSGEAKTMALFQQNGASMTEETPTVVVPAARKPVARLDAVMA